MASSPTCTPTICAAPSASASAWKRACSASTRGSSRTRPHRSAASSTPASAAKVGARESRSTWRRSTWRSRSICKQIELGVRPGGQHALVGEIIPFGAHPFDPAKQKLEKGLTGPERGPKDAAVTIVEFGDLQCPACKAAQPSIEALVAAEPTARFVFQNFPLEMHNWAAKGAAYADCVGHASNDAFWKFVAKTYETQSDITAENADEKLTALADGAGVKGSEIAACAVKPETKAHVNASIALGKSVDVTGTPTLYINGRKIGSLDPRMSDVYKALVEFAAKQGK